MAWGQAVSTLDPDDELDRMGWAGLDINSQSLWTFQDSETTISIIGKANSFFGDPSTGLP